MNRNTNMFAYNRPYLDMSRSRFKRNFDHKTSMNAARLIPIYVDEMLPADSVKINLGSLVRMSTPIFPVMDQCYMDVYFFAVPERLVYDHWNEMMGENKTDYWTQEIEYELPTIKNELDTGYTVGSIAHYMGVPINIKDIEVRADFFRAYTLIYNSWFRDENVVEPQHLYTDDTNRVITEELVDAEQAEYGLEPCKVAKFADYFTTALPNAQKGDPVRIPLGTTAPVYQAAGVDNTEYMQSGVEFAYNNGTAWNKNLPAGNRNIFAQSTGTISQMSLDTANYSNPQGAYNLAMKNLVADLSQATAADINQLRQAFAIQKMFERDAIGGTRYTEILRAHFGVTSPDARQQRPEYIGGKRIRINMSQVLQQSSTDATSPQGNTAAYSLTVDKSDMVSYSSTEHQIIMGLACIRTDHTYQQGLARMWGRRKRFDFYWPTFANLGNQFIRNEELYAQGTDEDKEAFGYQEAWAEYRYAPSRISGELTSTYSQPLDSWHYGDYFESLPTLSKDFIEETDANIQRTLAVQDHHQFICDFYFEQTWTRPMPVNSVPGLIDHH